MAFSLARICDEPTRYSREFSPRIVLPINVNICSSSSAQTMTNAMEGGEGVEPQYKYIIMHLPSSCAQPPGRNVTSVAFFLGKVNSATGHLLSSGAGFTARDSI
jgi:hypothetical protein